jgi:hypothetical protein
VAEAGEGDFVGRGCAADGLAGLVDADLDAGLGQRDGRAEAVGTAADDGCFSHKRITSESTIEQGLGQRRFEPAFAAGEV